KLALGAALAGALLCSGSKSAILGFGIAATTLYAMTRRLRWSFGALVATTAIAIAPVWVHRVLPVQDEHRGVERVFRAADVRDPGSSYGARLDYYRRSIALLRTRGWLGVGTGGWGPAVHLPTGRRYPHNMFFELACELGVAGLAVLALALVFGAIQLHTLVVQHRSPLLVATLVAMAVFWLLNAQLSGDLLDNRHIWWPLLLLERLHRDRRNAAGNRAMGPIGTDSFGALAAT